LIDALGTFYLWKKYQKQVTSRPYIEIFQPSIYTLLKMMIVGLPMNPDRVQEVHGILTAKEKVLNENIQENVYVKLFNTHLQEVAVEDAKILRVNKILAGVKVRTPVKTIEDFKDIKFNPASHIQLAKLLFEVLHLPVLDTTKSDAASTSKDVLKDLENHTTDQDILDLLEFIQELNEASKINGTFIKAFMQEGLFLHGSLKLAGTQSGRLSSSDPNLTNLPAHGPMGKLTKSCIVAPEGKTTINQQKLHAIINSFK
jgi:DNA polymerase-1